MAKRKYRNRGAVFVDLDNWRRTVQAYAELGADLVTLSDLLDWIEAPSLGLTEVWRIYVFGTYDNRERPTPQETLLERRHRNADNVRMINFQMPGQPGIPGYEDRVILEEMERTQGYWNTGIIVSSDHIAFRWADLIRHDRSPFLDKEAVVLFSHLSVSTYMAAKAGNAKSIEDIFPPLNRIYRTHRGYNPLGEVERLSA